MRRTGIAIFAAAAAMWLVSVSPSAAAGPSQDADRDAKSAPGAKPADKLGTAIERRIAGKADLDEVRVEVRWRRKDGNMVSCRVYGRGVGIWNDATQFQMSRSQVLDILRALVKAHFGTMETKYGGEEEGEEREEGVYLHGTIAVRVGLDVKRVTQYMGGEQFAPLVNLGEKVLAMSEKAAKKGIRVASLSEGLSDLAAGKLAPETLQILIQRKADRPGVGEEDGSWILRMDGRRVVDRSLSGGDKTGVLRLLVLSDEDFRRFAALLRENDPQGLPRNLYSPQYVHLDIRLLGGHRDLSGRRYAGTTPDTHGEKQVEFDRIYTALRALHQRVEKGGSVLPADAE